VEEEETVLLYLKMLEERKSERQTNGNKRGRG